MEKSKVKKTITVDLNASNDVPPSVRYADMTSEELSEALERELERCSTFKSWEDAL